ncbi:uncharacterized protein LOC101488864 precursor [Cicer arietinum]|uniref:Uncharacterized protein LOC101488864 precursor n=2 Tax=Cicer arietinum TaxID=3827 RepID=Q8L5X7_CICAR|nr:uncharacterized protein LOC101488864 precursor [Cicer arietinum]CAD31715.1 hypothetical protein [Cicer arietinum]
MQMGFRVLSPFSLLIFLNLASSYAIKNIVPSEFVQKNKLQDKGIYGSKMEGGGVHGGGAHGGQSHGGGAVIPIYAAGAANKNHQPPSHRGAADCNLNKIKFSSMLMMIFVYPLTLLFLLTY